jgi:hypothetical protein
MGKANQFDIVWLARSWSQSAVIKTTSHTQSIAGAIKRH